MIPRFFGGLLLGTVALWANPWVMFSDVDDTYIYNQKTGEVYVRFRKGGKNYEDVFVKMPQGIDPSSASNKPLELPLGSIKGGASEEEEQRQKILQRAQELKKNLYNQAIE